jgi:hypothetical protein
MTRRLDALLLQLAFELRSDLYDNIIVPIVQDWFTTWDSTNALSLRLDAEIRAAWPRVERKVSEALAEAGRSFDSAPTHTVQSPGVPTFNEATLQITKSVTMLPAAALAALSGTILGGAGVALIAEGPPGWIAGFVLGALVLAVGKSRVDSWLQPGIKYMKVPPLLKKRGKSKVATELALGAPKFQDEIRNALRRSAADLYKAIDDG